MKQLARDYIHFGLKRAVCLKITGLKVNQLYYRSNGRKAGRQPSQFTLWRDPETMIEGLVSNDVVVQKIIEIKLNPDLSNWYRLITCHLKVRGYYINHKKVYRLMSSYSLMEKARKRTGRNFVKYRRVSPTKPLQILEMDIKYFWIHQHRRYAFVLTILDTFTRYVLNWSVGFSMKSEQVKRAWEYIIAEFLQEEKLRNKTVEVEVRSDNGKQFNSHLIINFFKDNYMNQVFTHPYTPEENGHVESFHNTLGKALRHDIFNSVNQLEKRLKKFYTCYNNERSHSSLKGVAPSKFWRLYELDEIEIIPLEKRKHKINLLRPLQDILTLPNICKHDYRAI